VQSSTAPLLRQLESMERQNRARSSAWAELETSLRTQLEDSVVENESLAKERNDLRSTLNRLKRIGKDRDEELSNSKAKLEEQTTKVRTLESRLAEIEAEGQKRKEEWEEVERVANEGVAKVRSEMTKTMVESEERHQAQIKAMQNELNDERDKRSQLQRQVKELMENAGTLEAISTPTTGIVMKTKVPKKLRSAEGQVDILANTLSGLDLGMEDDIHDVEVDATENGGPSSFAAMEQLDQRLKAATVEVEALRRSLAASERTRESLVEELGETRQAKEKLPLFEQKVQELSQENRQKDMEIMTLTEDIAEVRQLYRTQLNALLEEKAATLSATEPQAEPSDNNNTSDAVAIPPMSSDVNGSGPASSPPPSGPSLEPKQIQD